MSVTSTLRFASITKLYLDPLSPRIGRNCMEVAASQEQLLEWMLAWKLDELGRSYLANRGFWTYEPLLVAVEPIYQQKRAHVVIDGNRRLAALRCLKNAVEGQPLSKKWEQIAAEATIPKALFSKIPYVVADSRDEAKDSQGFRHVTGIKQWDADEKAGFIVQLVDGDNLSYDQVARKIGVSTSAVRQHYIAFHIRSQIEQHVVEIPRESTGCRFVVLYDSIQKTGVQAYLGLNLNAAPKAARTPIQKNRLPQLAFFSRWIYGTHTTEPLVTEPRMISDFGKILESEAATKYLEETEAPIFDVALLFTDCDQRVILHLVNSAREQIEETLRTINLLKPSPDLQRIVTRFKNDARRLLSMTEATTVKQK